ncbi:MAG: tetratricopeptide repeat protein [Oscillatoriales cyanobacterium]|nr:MAG: tetratricopeptide repeat protein [Oscillatoriales cyanobacterium]TAE04785.1 MAG: tetratricopeptide repeat protein [Oscillatoriales cyanobacterium]
MNNSLQVHEETASNYFHRGNLLKQSDKFEEAAAAYQRCTEINPDFSWYHHNLGEVLAKLGQWDGAEKSYRKACELNQNSAWSWHNLGEVLVHHGNINEAVAAYRKAVEIYPDFYEFYNSLGQALCLQGQLDESVSCLRQAIELDSESALPYQNLWEALARLGRVDEGMDCLRRAIELNPGEGDLYLKLAEAFQNKNEFAEAVSYYRKALQLKPDFHWLYYKLGTALSAQGQWEEAIAFYSKAAELDPSSAIVHHYLGHTLSIVQRWEEAIVSYRKALDIVPNAAVIYQHLGDALARLQKWEQAVGSYRKSVECDPNSLEAQDHLGFALYQLGRCDEAILAYRKAWEISPNSEVVKQHLAEALGKQEIEVVNSLYEPKDCELKQSTFCEKLYLQFHTDVAEGVNKGTFKSGFDHWLEYGSSEDIQGVRKRIPGYIEAVYLRENPDVSDVVIRGIYKSGYEHFLLHGWAEGTSRLKSIQIELEQKKQIWIDNIDIPASLHRLAQLTYKPIISIIVPVFNPEREFLELCIESVKKQIYPHWELCLVDDGSNAVYVRDVLLSYEKQDSRIKATFLSQNSGISAASRTALQLATGEFIGLLDHDDEITPDALLEIACALNNDPNLDVIYSDEDKFSVHGESFDQTFKPGWSPDLLTSTMYIGHFTVYRATIIGLAGSFRSAFDGTQDYDLALRVSAITDRFHHIPKILYHWRATNTSTAQSLANKPDAVELQKQALMSYLEKQKLSGQVVSRLSAGNWRIIYAPPESQPLVSIVIPTAGRSAMIGGRSIDLLCNCIQSVIDYAGYNNYEFIVIENGDLSQATRQFLNNIKNIHLVNYQSSQFNLAEKINLGVKAAKGEFILLLNDDTQAITPNFLFEMLGLASLNKVGAVGVKLLFENCTLQHIGVLWSDSGPTHSMIGEHPLTNGPQAMLQLTHNAVATTGACLLTRRDVYLSVGGFNEELLLNYNDVEFCFKLRQMGLRIVIEPSIEWFHFEGQSKSGTNLWELEQFTLLWGYPSDPFYNPNFRHSSPFYEKNFPQKREKNEFDYISWKIQRLVTRNHQIKLSNEDIKFSLVLSVYNVKQRYLCELEATILRQTYQNFEWIIVDNGSDLPECRAWLEKISQQEKVHYFRLETNQGIMGGYGAAFKAASGDYIIPVDADDFLTIDALKIMAAYIDRHQWPAALYSDEDKTNIDSTVASPFLKPDWDALLFTNICFVAHVCAIKRSVAIEVGAYQDNNAAGCHDWDTFLRIVRAGYQPIHVPELLYSWRIHPGSTASIETGTKPYTITSQQYVLNQHLRLTKLGTHFEVVTNDLFNHDGIWRLQPRTSALPKATIVVEISVGTSTDQIVKYFHSHLVNLVYPDFNLALVFPDNALMETFKKLLGFKSDNFVFQNISIYTIQANSTVSALQVLAKNNILLGEVIAFLDSRLYPSTPTWAQEMAGIIHGFDNVVLAGGRIINENNLLWAGGFFGIDGFIGSPDTNRSLDDSGYFGTVNCQRCVDAVSPLFWAIDQNFLLTFLANLPPETDGGVLATYLSCLSYSENKSVAYTPFATAKTDRPRLITGPAIVPQDLLQKFGLSIPEYSRYYHPLLSQHSDRNYALGDPLREIWVKA